MTNLNFLNKKRTATEQLTKHTSETPEKENGRESAENNNINKTQPEEIKPKKIRSISPIITQIPKVIQEDLNTIKAEIRQNQDQYVINDEQFEEFLDNANGSQEPLNISREYTTDTNRLIQMIEKLYTKLTTKSMKQRFTRINNKIKVQIVDEQNSSNPNSVKELQDENNSMEH